MGEGWVGCHETKMPQVTGLEHLAHVWRALEGCCCLVLTSADFDVGATR